MRPSSPESQACPARACRYAAGLSLLLMLMHPGRLHGQPITPVGTDTTLDVATWNLTWFGHAGRSPEDARQFAHVRHVIEQSGIDLWALQEISDGRDFERLLEALGSGYGGLLSTASTNLRTGFIYRTDVVHLQKSRSILTAFAHPFAGRPPLVLSANIARPDTTLPLTFINLHMKCCSDGYERRQEAARHLKAYLDTLRQEMPVVVMGDFNDGLQQSITAGRRSPYLNFTQDTTRYLLPTLPLEQAGACTFLGRTSCSTIDHIIITTNLRAAWEITTSDTYAALTRDIADFSETTSDHLPVYVRLHRKRSLRIPEQTAVLSFFPHPFSGRATLHYALDRPGPVRITLHDLLGRRLRVVVDGFREAGTYSTLVDASNLPGGTYLLRIALETRAITRRIVHIR